MNYRNHSGHNKCIAKNTLCIIRSVMKGKNCTCTQNAQKICESMTISNEQQDVRWIISLSNYVLIPPSWLVNQKQILRLVMGFGKVSFRKSLKWHQYVQLSHLKYRCISEKSDEDLFTFKHLCPDIDKSSMTVGIVLLAGVGWLTKVST